MRKSEAATNTALVPTAAQRGGDFSDQLDLTSPTLDPQNNNAQVLDCNGNKTYSGELFNTRQTQASSLNGSGYCGVPFGYVGGVAKQ